MEKKGENQGFVLEKINSSIKFGLEKIDSSFRFLPGESLDGKMGLITFYCPFNKVYTKELAINLILRTYPTIYCIID